MSVVSPEKGLKLILLFFIVSFSIFLVLTIYLINLVKINGALHEEQIRGERLISDVLPPPGYIVDAHLYATHHHHGEGKANLKEAAAVIGKHESEYRKSFETWSEGSDLTKKEFAESDKYVDEYFNIVNSLLSGSPDSPFEIDGSTLKKLDDLFFLHKSRIEEIVRLQKARNLAVHEAIDSKIHFAIVLLCVVAVMILVAVTILTTIMGRQIAKINDQSRRMREDAEAANKAKTEFLASMSHEIRTPLTGIIGFSEELLEMENDPEKRDYLETIDSCSQRLLGVVNNVLSLSKIESGQFVVKKKPTRLKESIDKLAKSFGKLAKLANLSFCVNIGERVDGEYMLDGQLFNQILANLLSNAIKYTNDGRVELTIDVSTREEGEGVHDIVVVVKDTGVGISEASINRIFDPYAQVGDRKIPSPENSTGLGLTIVKKLVDHLDGKIQVESVPGTGTTFTVSIPVESCREAEDSKPRESNQDEFDGRRLRILCAEDNPVNQRLLSKVLSSFGFDARMVSDGEELLDRHRTERDQFDVVLVDTQMPRIGGLEAVRTMREREKANHWRRVPIIGISSKAFREDVDRALAAGMDDYLSKPFKRREMLRKIRALAKAADGESRSV